MRMHVFHSPTEWVQPTSASQRLAAYPMLGGEANVLLSHLDARGPRFLLEDMLLRAGS